MVLTLLRTHECRHVTQSIMARGWLYARCVYLVTPSVAEQLLYMPIVYCLVFMISCCEYTMTVWKKTKKPDTGRQCFNGVYRPQCLRKLQAVSTEHLVLDLLMYRAYLCLRRQQSVTTTNVGLHHWFAGLQTALWSSVADDSTCTSNEQHVAYTFFSCVTIKTSTRSLPSFKKYVGREVAVVSRGTVDGETA